MRDCTRAFARPPARPRRVVLAILAVLACIATACRDSPISLLSDFQTVEAEDGSLEVKIPKSWTVRSDMNPSATIQMGDREREAYGLVMVNPRAWYENLSLGKFADYELQDFLNTVGDPVVSGPELVLVDGSEALQFEVRGIVDEQNMVYLYTFAETSDRILQIVMWTFGSRFEDNRQDMVDVTQSVRQLEPLGDVRPSPVEAPTDAPGADSTPVPGIDRGDRN